MVALARGATARGRGNGGTQCRWAACGHYWGLVGEVAEFCYL